MVKSGGVRQHVQYKRSEQALVFSSPGLAKLDCRRCTTMETGCFASNIQSKTKCSQFYLQKIMLHFAPLNFPHSAAGSCGCDVYTPGYAQTFGAKVHFRCADFGDGGSYLSVFLNDITL